VYQAFACAVTTIPGFNERILPLMNAGFAQWWPFLQKILNQGIGNTVLAYRDWMDGALSFERAPIPPDGVPELTYFLGALRNESYQARVNRFEREHAERKAEVVGDEEGRISDAEMEGILATSGIAGSRRT